MFIPVPVGTERRIRRLPLATVTLIGVNAAVWLATVLYASSDELGVPGAVLGYPGDHLQRVVKCLGLMPRELHLYALLTSVFTHVDIFHVVGNMLFLWVFGRHVEDAVGWWKFLVVYFACHLGAAMLHMTMQAFYGTSQELRLPMVGASGAVSGVLGYFVIRFYGTNVLIWYLLLLCCIPKWGSFWIRSVWAIGFYIVGELAWGLMSTQGIGGGVAHWAHVGGFLAGMLFAYGLSAKDEGGREYKRDEADAHFARGRYQQAAHGYRQMLSTSPDDIGLMEKLATTYDMMGQPDWSVEPYSRALRLLLKERRRQEAIELFHAFRRLHPDPSVLGAELLFDIGVACQDAMADEEALWVLDSMARTDPSSAEAEGALLRCGLLCLDRLRQPQRALQYLTALRQQRPDSPFMPQVQEAIARAEAALGRGQ